MWFLAQLSWRLKWAFLIKISQLSVIVVVVVIVVLVNFSHFHLLLKNHWVNFSQPWHKTSLGKGKQVYSNEGPCPFPRGDKYKIAKLHWKNFKVFSSRTTGPISTKPANRFKKKKNWWIWKIYKWYLYRYFFYFTKKTRDPWAT